MVFGLSILLTQVALADGTTDNSPNINYQVIVVDDPADTSKVKKNVWVNMYYVKVVDGNYVGTRIKSVNTGKDGYQAVFKVKPGKLVDFLAFKIKTKAKGSKNKKHTFTVPPQKNFFKEDGVASLCYINGIDETTKLKALDGVAELCATAENGFLQGILELSK